jgi:predicted alpha/beta hydrolase
MRIDVTLDVHVESRRDATIVPPMPRTDPVSQRGHANVREERLAVQARDGYRLGATLYRRDEDSPVAVVFNGGGGLASIRYRHFLRFLASRGFAVLAYDYRGVGASRPVRLRGFVAGLDDWAALDHSAAIDLALERFRGARIASVSHSIGCLVACAAPNASSLAQMVFVCPHTGYWKDYRARWRIPMAFAWHFAMPAIARAVGYFPGSALRIGDDFPLRFAMQWAGRTTPAFRTEQHAEDRLLDNARALRVPALALTVFDDAFVSDAAARRFLHAIPGVPVVRRHVEPHETRGERVGHFGFFRRRHAALWPIVARFLAGDGNAPAIRPSP